MTLQVLMFIGKMISFHYFNSLTLQFFTSGEIQDIWIFNNYRLTFSKIYE